METKGITLDQLHNFLEAKFEQIERRFDLNDRRLEYLEAKMDSKFEIIERRLDGIEKRIDGLEKRIDGLERRIENLERITQEIYDKRDKVSMEFNRRVLLGNSLLAGVVAFIVAMFTGKYQSS